MDFILDNSGAPMVQFSEKMYICVLPVTKYQFERYIWKTAPAWCDYEMVIKKTGRVSPSKVTSHNLSQAFLTKINFEEALKISAWLGGRPPTEEEWDEAYKGVFSKDDLLEEAFRFLEIGEPLHNRNNCGTFSGEKRHVDRRFIEFLRKLISLEVQRKNLNDRNINNNDVGELVSEYPISGDSIEPYDGMIFLKYPGRRVRVTGRPILSMRNRTYGCGYVIER